MADASKAAGGPGQVVVVAHSMGGLAVRQAASLTRTGTAEPAADAIGLLVTIATPNTGSWSDGLFHNTRGASGGLGVVGSAVAWLAQGTCGAIGGVAGSTQFGDRPWLCSPLQGSTSAAGTAMVPGSRQLAALPALPPQIPVYAVAGQLTVTAKLFWGTTYNLLAPDALGDLLVKPNSALAYGGRYGADQYLEACALAEHEFTKNFGWQACEHGGLLYDNQVGQHILDRVTAFVARAEAGAKLTLAVDGIGPLRFGDPQPKVLAALIAAFGSPGGHWHLTDDNCITGSTGLVGDIYLWGDLVVYFSNETTGLGTTHTPPHLWSYSLIGDSTQQFTVKRHLGLKTSGNIGLGSTGAALRAAFGAKAVFSHAAPPRWPGAYYLVGAPGVPGSSWIFAMDRDSPDGIVNDIEVGGGCGE